MQRVKTLLQAIRRVSIHAGIRLHPGPKEGVWVGTVYVSDVVLAEHTGTPEEICEALSERLRVISRGVLAALGPTDPSAESDGS